MPKCTGITALGFESFVTYPLLDLEKILNSALVSLLTTWGPEWWVFCELMYVQHLGQCLAYRMRLVLLTINTVLRV